MARTPATGTTRGTITGFRLDPREVASLDSQRVERGGMSRSTYFRWLIEQDAKKIAREKGTTGT